MAKSKPTTILLIGEPNRRQREADGTIKPGNLLQLDADNKVVNHSTAQGRHARMVAVENDIAGDDYQHDYAAGEVVQINIFRPGDEALLNLADGENVSIGDYLVSDGAGRVQKADSNSAGELEGSLVAVALEAINLSDSSAADPSFRLKAMFV